MENQKLTNPISEELNEEDLHMVSGGSDNGKIITTLPLGDPAQRMCPVCRKIRTIDLMYIYNEKMICKSCMAQNDHR